MERGETAKMKGGWLPGLIPPGHRSELQGHAANDNEWIHRKTVDLCQLDKAPPNIVIKR
jgi:hypothetical protein